MTQLEITIMNSHDSTHEIGEAQDYFYCLEEDCEKYDMPVKDVEQSSAVDGGEDYFREGDR